MLLVNLNFSIILRIGWIYILTATEKYIGLKKGCKSIELDSAFHRILAHEFYEKNGFIKRAFEFSLDL